jgi:outer membrane protein TolC
MRLNAPSHFITLIALAGLSACTHTPAVDESAALMAHSALIPALSAETSNKPYVDEAWWHAVGGEPLQQLVSQGLSRNTDIGVALTRVMEARAGLSARSSALLPSLDANGVYSNQRSGLPPAVKQGKPDTRAIQASLALNWELDLFGRNRSAADAAEQDVLRSEAGVAGARLMLIAEVARQFVLHQGAVRKLASLDEIIALQAATQTLLEHQAREGQIANLQVDMGLARLQELRAQRPPLMTLQSVTRAHLARLTGSTPDEVSLVLQQATVPAAPWILPPQIPTGQPVELLARRPDIIAAQSAWRGELARLDSAKTDMLPRFFLNLLTGRQDLRLNGMDLAPVGYQQTALVFALPLFNAGRVQAGIDMQDAAAQRAELQYEQAIRQAADDVESALAQFHQSRKRAVEVGLAMNARRDASAKGKRLFEEGQISKGDRMALEQAHASARLNETESQEFVRLALIQLHQALGGGWRNSPPHALEASATSDTSDIAKK